MQVSFVVNAPVGGRITGTAQLNGVDIAGSPWSIPVLDFLLKSSQWRIRDMLDSSGGVTGIPSTYAYRLFQLESCFHSRSAYVAIIEQARAGLAWLGGSGDWTSAYLLRSASIIGAKTRTYMLGWSIRSYVLHFE